jgi:hypothetical protein
VTSSAPDRERAASSTPSIGSTGSLPPIGHRSGASSRRYELLGSCAQARDHYGVECACDPHDHIYDDLVPVRCTCGFGFLTCRPIADVAEFINDAGRW